MKKEDPFKDHLVENVVIEPEQQHQNSPQQTSLHQLIGSLTFTVFAKVADTDAQTAAKYGPVFIAPFPCALIKFQERHAVAGSDAGAVTLDLEKVSSGTAKGSGTTMLASTLDLKAAADTIQNGSLTATYANRELAIGDAIALKTSGALTALKDVCVELTFKVLLTKINI
ncbi:MAG: hypothetical protein M1383_06275 [Patescibacteria group bacterium]|nr:hypothetical protein [Patescibacteria group bacterium]